MSLEIWKFGFSLRISRKTGWGQRGHRGQMPLLRDTEAWGEAQVPFASLHSQEAGEASDLVPGYTPASQCLSLQALFAGLPGSPGWGLSRLQEAPAAGREAAFWAHKPLLADLLAIPSPPHPNGCKRGLAGKVLLVLPRRLLILLPHRVAC